MAGYTRVDTSNNIADGNVISAADLDNEFDGIQAAFNASTGHNHDGTTGEGAPILVLGPTQDVVVGASTVTPKTTNTVDIGSSSLKFKDLYLAGNASIAGTLGVTGATTLSAALTYGGVTLSNAVTGTGNMVLSASPTLTGTLSGANASLSGTLAVTGVATLTAQPILSSLTASRAVFTDGSKGLVSNAITGTGNVVMSTSPTLVTPVLGTPASVTLTNGTGLPVSTGISGLGTGVATALAVNVGSAGAPVVNGGALGTPSSGTVTNLTGTASININGTVGATTANTGAFTTLTTSSTVTLNGGTANGVAYLNGSKVLTTGSALTFDGSSLAVTLTSTVTPSVRLYYNGSSQYGLHSMDANGNYIIESPAANGVTSGQLYLKGYLAIPFAIAGSEQMRLTSTGLGIGTSSPAAKLHVSGDALANTFKLIANTTVSGSDATIFRPADNTMAFSTNGAERMRIDSSGNVGIGTSSPNVSGLEISRATGTSSPTPAELRLSTTNNASDWSTTLPWGRLSFYSADTSNGGPAIRGAMDCIADSIAGGGASLAFSVSPSGTLVEAMRITSAGNVGIGTSSPSQRLEVVSSVSPFARFRSTASAFTGVDIGQNSAGAGIIDVRDNQPLILYTNDTERARIDSSGNLLVGTTSFAAGQNSKSIQPDAIFSSRSTTGGDGHIIFYNPNGVVGQIYTSGSSTTFATSSDYRLKENITPMTGALAVVQQLNPVTYTWKVDGSNGEGFIAHELQEVCPAAVVGEKDAVDADGNPQYQGIDTSFLVATLTAAIQEQQALIESLKARLDAANL